jgi:hypothetical protein
VRQHRVVGDAGAGAVLEAHEAAPRAGAVPDQEWRQAAVRGGIEEAGDPALREERHLGERHLRVVDRERERLAVEVAAVQDDVVLGKKVGLSQTALTSIATASCTWASVARTAPSTCGTQRSVYGSCTASCGPPPSGPRASAPAHAPCCRRGGAEVRRRRPLSGWGRTAWRRASNASGLRAEDVDDERGDGFGHDDEVVARPRARSAACAGLARGTVHERQPFAALERRAA